ncbi:MAG TPA: family 78 glycoside hydrolase catalytic domain [Caulobacteraceae bacterium]|nr:family 78 glycoside hydrolase catalytic domain [Caulobacteraceae bacterium]
MNDNTAAVAIADPRIDDDSDLIATGHAAPRLSWRLASDVADVLQQAYEIEIADNPEFRGAASSGEVAQARPYLAPWPGPPLQSREVRYWRVRARTNLGWTGWSEPCRVEASLLARSDWTARPISPRSNVGRRTSGPAPLLRREFTVDAPVAKARLYVTALGVREVQINGAPVSGDVLEPGWTVYPKRLLFAAYDVGARLSPRANVISAMVGEGWFRGDLTWHLHRNVYGDTTALLAQLEITLRDGRRLVIGTDGTWRGAYGAVREAELYHGAQMDLRCEPHGWRLPGFDDSGWEGVTALELPQGLEARDMPAVRLIERRDLPARPGVADVGQNITGYLKLRASGPAGARVTVRHAEVLDAEGALFTASLRNARAADAYVLDGRGAGELAPPFTFHGFRYAEITPDEGVKIESVTAETIATDIKRTGAFACSDAAVNKLFDNVLWSQRGNFLAIPTDCPQRDERLGWTGDLEVFAPTAFLNSDARSFVVSWLKDLALEQRNGAVPWVVPDALAGEERARGAAAWGDAAAITPWDVYRFFGDREVLERQFPSMKAWVDWCASRTGPEGLWTQDFQFGDWLDPDAPPDMPFKAKVPFGFVATAYLANSAGLAARAARLLGEAPGVAEAYDDLQRRTAAAAWERWGEEAQKSQTGCALAIEFAIAPAQERQAIGARLAELVENNGHRIGTGFVGTPLILPALTHTGHLETAYRMLLNPDCPGWLYQVKAGATTIWERWDALRADGSVNMGGFRQDASMVSFNHYAYGAVAAWLYRTVAGLDIDLTDPAEPLSLAPRPGGGLAWAEAEAGTPYGRLAIRWELAGGELTIRADVPAGAVARFSAPEGYRAASGSLPTRLGSGRRVLVLSPV